MKTILKAFCLIAIFGLVLGFSPIKPVSADTLVPVFVLDTSYSTGVYSAYYGPSAYSAVSPGSVAYYDGREAGVIKAGINIDTDGHYWDEGIFAVIPTVTIDAFAAGVVSYDVETQYGENPVWMTIEVDTGVVGDRGDNVTYQHVPTTNPAGWHTVDAAAGLWQKWNNNDGDVTGNPLISLSQVASDNTGLNVVRTYLRLGMGDSYHGVAGLGTVAWVDKFSVGGVTYDFQLTHPYTWYVSPTGSDSNFGTEASPFLTIQKAIDASTNGDTINVTAGTYVLSSAIAVNKDVTLTGVDNPLIQVSGTGERIIMTTAGATLQGFWIEKTDKTGVQNIIYVGANNLTIQNNKVWGQFVIGDGEVSRAMVFTGGLSGLLIDNNEFYGLRQPGYISGVTTGTISNNYTHGTKGWVIEQGNLTFTNNTWGTGADANVYDIAILATTSSSYYTNVPAMSAANNNASIEDQRTSPRTLSIVYVDASAPSCTVDCGTAAHPYPTIAEGITRVVTGGTIHVAAGTYAESLSIQKSLKLIGTGSGTTTILAPSSLPVATDLNSVVIGVVGSGVSAEITGFTISGPGPSTCGSIKAGIYVRGGAYANIHDNIIADIRDNTAPVSGCQNGIGILVGRQADATTGTATIADNQIIRYQKGGIVVDNTGSNAVITNNLVTGIGETTITAQNGIQISRGATATISGNTVTGNSFHLTGSGWDWGAAGILTYNSGSITLGDGNTISGNDQGLYLSGATCPVTLGAEVFGPLSAAPVGTGYYVVNQSPCPLNLSGSTFNGVLPTDPNADLLIKPLIWDGTDETGMGLVTLKTGYVFVSEGGSIQQAINLATPGDTVMVGSGTYNEDVNVNKTITLMGAGAGSTTISGPIGGAGSTITVSTSNAVIEGFTITRAGNNVTDWNNAGLNTAGIAIQGQSLTGTVIRNNIITHMRTGIDINNSNGHSIMNNTITDNRTGMIFRNQTDNMTVTGNEITNNWTVGVLFLDASGGSNVPVQTAANGHFNNNNITGNWYGQVVDRQSGGSLLVPGTNLKNFAQNWWGTTTPVISSANSTEPGYAAQIPVEFGGTAVAPGGQPDILGPAVANIVYWPLCSDLACSTTSYPPVHNITKGTYYFTIQAAIAAASSGDTINVAPGTYTEVGQIVINKNLTIIGADEATTIIKPAQDTTGVADSGSWFLVNQGVTFDLSYVTLDGTGRDIRQGIRTNGNTVVDHVTVQNMVSAGYSGFGIAQGYTNTVPQSLTVTNSTITGFGRVGIQLDEGSAASTGTISNNTITCIGAGDNVSYGITVEGGATATITGNTITNCYGVASTDSSESAAIEVSTYFAPGTTATITGNFIYNNLNGILVGYDAADTSVVTAENNKIYNINESLIESSGTSAVVDASPNWWGTAYFATIDPKIVGTLTFQPYWVDEGMTILSNVPVSTVYVDDDYVAMTDCGTHTCGYDAFATIQEGISTVTTGGTVNVGAGTYTQDLSINKAVTLLGPNATINPNTGTRVAEAVIHPSTSYPDPSICTNMAYLTTSNITIKGFTFDGDNPAVDSGVMIGTADVNACEILAGYEGMGNIVVENNILKNATYAGIDFYNYTSSVATAGNYVRYNLIQNIGTATYGYGIGTLVYNNFYADITNNVFDNVRVGVQTGNFSQANPGTTGSISNNTINAWRLGIFHNLWYASASPLTISNNNIKAIANPDATKWVGMLISTLQQTTNATVSGNNITIPGTISYPAPNYTTGISVWNTTTSAPLTISGGTITGGDYGIWVNNYEGYSSNAGNTSINISGVTVLDSGIAGILVKDSPSNTNGSTVYANIQSSSIDTNGTGILVEGADATAVANYSNLAGNPTAGITNLNTTFTMDGTNNWWGSTTGPGPVGPGTGVNVSTFVDYGSWRSVHNLTKDTWYGTIQPAIDDANAGDQILLGAITYKENVIVNKSVEIFGAGQGSTIVMPAISAANPCTGSSLCGGAASNVFLVQANDVKIHDLTIDGDNPGLTSSIVRGGADVDARNGIIKNTSGTYNNLEVYNVTVQNIYLRGIYSTGGSFNFHNNIVTNVQGDGYSIGIFAWGGPGIISTNTVSYANDAISANHSTGIQFLNNTVTHSGSGVHTDNSNDGGGVADVISGNNVSSCTPGGYGIWTFVNYNTITVSNNTVSDCEIAYSAWGSGNTTVVSFNNNTATAPSPNTGSVGIYVTTSEAGWGYADVYANFTGNIITGFETGIDVTANETTWDPLPYVAKTITADFYHNQVTGSTEMAAYQGTQGIYVVDYTENWWGARLGPDSLLMSPGITYTRWCGDAACTFLYPVALGEPVGTKTSWDQYFHWEGVSGASSYILELYNAGDVLVTSTSINPSVACVGTSCSYIFTPSLPLDYETTYHWRVRDTYSGGNGTWSSYNYFTLNTPACYMLTIVIDPAGSGDVTRNIPTNCTVGAQNGYFDGTAITLTATPTAGGYDRFTGWSGGGCSGTGTCTVTITSATEVTAVFEHATFADVPFDHPQYSFIQAIYDAGYTSGCGTSPLRYCPDQTMNRAESSVFMLRGNFGNTYVPPLAPWGTFADDWTQGPWAEKWAEGMWDEGMTAGCWTDPLRFCPWELFNREQAAVFGLRMKYGMSYIPPAASGTVFADMTDTSYWATKWAEQAYTDGLLPACGTQGTQPLFCPSDQVTRGWGAYVIVKAKNLTITP